MMPHRIASFVLHPDLPASASGWKLRNLDSATIIAVSDDHGAYLIVNGKAESIRFDRAVLNAHAQFGGDLAEMQVRYDRADTVMFSEIQDPTKW